MKVGILTFHNVTNYGGVLQCFALQNALSNLDYDAEVIDYTNEYFKKYYSPFFIQEKNLRKFLYMVYAFRQKCGRNKKFREFRDKWLKMSEQTFDAKSIIQVDTIYDAIITGSDQVWNMELTRGDENYMLPFCKKAKKVSYAASFGFSKVPNQLREVYAEDLKGYSAMSVREESAAQIVKDLIGIEPPVQIDPVFLLTENQWEKTLDGEPRLCEQEYICVYKINQSEAYNLAKRLSAETNLPVVTIKADKTCPREFIKLKEASPTDFVNAIYNAKYVITDSFHGTAFSIVFKKNFVSCADKRKNNRNTRIDNVLKCFQLSHRTDASGLSALESQDDMKTVDQLIAQERKKAFEFLNRALS